MGRLVSEIPLMAIDMGELSTIVSNTVVSVFPNTVFLYFAGAGSIES
jgi:hypothetical protein